MRVIYFKPFHKEGLVKAYTESMSLLAPEDWAVICDHDTLLFTEAGQIIEQAIADNPDAWLITGLTNRSGYRSQMYNNRIHESGDMRMWRKAAQVMAAKKPQYTDITAEHVTGAIMVVKKEKWDLITANWKLGDHKFLGVDDAIMQAIRELGGKIVRCDNLFFFHYYRLLEGHGNIKHLQV